jgi:hypothetical protein
MIKCFMCTWFIPKLHVLLQKRNDREEIRRRLAMGVEAEDGQEPDKGKKLSLHSRLQSG